MAIKNKSLIIWSILLEIPFVYLAAQYWVTNSLAVYDASSHLGAAWYLKNYLWPAFSGWNSLNLAGYVQGLSYPPLFHYLAATLSFVASVESVIKLLISLSLLALPISVFLFTSIFLKNIKARVFSTAVILLLVFALPGYFGANIKALFQIGLLPSFFSLPLFFFFLWAILRNKSNWVANSLLLAAILLTHLVAGIFCLLALMSLIIARRVKKQPIRKDVLNLIASLLLASFFLIPFVVNYPLLSQSFHVSSLLIVNLTCFIITLPLSYYFFRKNQINLLSLAILSTSVSALLVIDSLSARFFAASFLSQKLYSLHLYRYQAYLYLLISFLIVYFPAKFLFETLKKPRVRPELVVAMPLLVLVVLTLWKNPVVVKEAEVKVVNKSQAGRFLETFSREASYPLVYSSQNQIIKDFSREWAYGLFTDATPNGPYLSSLVRSFDPFNKDEPGQNLIERKSIARTKLYPMLDLFAINNLLYLDPSQSSSNEKISTLLLPSTDSQLIALPGVKLTKVSSDWSERVEKWWLAPGKLEEVLIYDPGNSLKLKVDKPSAKITNFEHNKTFSKFSFEVEAVEETSVLVKFTNFPGWKASAGGQDLKIYQASPYLMLIQAKGKVEFEYQKPWYHPVSLGLSLVTLVVITYLGIQKKRRN